MFRVVPDLEDPCSEQFLTWKVDGKQVYLCSEIFPDQFDACSKYVNKHEDTCTCTFEYIEDTTSQLQYTDNDSHKQS